MSDLQQVHIILDDDYYRDLAMSYEYIIESYCDHNQMQDIKQWLNGFNCEHLAGFAFRTHGNEVSVLHWRTIDSLAEYPYTTLFHFRFKYKADAALFRLTF